MKQLQQALQAKINEMTKNGQKLFKVDIDRDEIFNVYLNSFEEDDRQFYNCNCCKSFLRQYGGIVAIKDGVVESIWDIDTPEEEYAQSAKALKNMSSH